MNTRTGSPVTGIRISWKLKYTQIKHVSFILYTQPFIFIATEQPYHNLPTVVTLILTSQAYENFRARPMNNINM